MSFDREKLEYRAKAYYRDTLPGAGTIFYSGHTTQHDAYELAEGLETCGLFEEAQVEKHIQGEGWVRDVPPHEPSDEGMEEMSAGIEGTPERRGCNACDWIGFASETIHPKHVDAMLLCPVCNETTYAVGCQSVSAEMTNDERRQESDMERQMLHGE